MSLQKRGGDSEPDDDMDDIDIELDEIDETIEVDQLDDDNEDNEMEIDSDDDEDHQETAGDYISHDTNRIDEERVQTETMVLDDDRVTSNRLSRYEMVELINYRALQISKNPLCFVDITGMRDPVEMAIKELYQNKCPLMVKREVAPNMFELWNPNLMVKPQL